MPEKTQSFKEVYTITEREAGKAMWTRIGIGFVNRDSSINIMLESLPLNGKLHVRDPRPAKEPRKGE